MTKKKIAAILAALLAILGGILALIDDDPKTSPNVTEIVTEVGNAVEAVKAEPEAPALVVPEAPEVVE